MTLRAPESMEAPVNSPGRLQYFRISRSYGLILGVDFSFQRGYTAKCNIFIPLSSKVAESTDHISYESTY